MVLLCFILSAFFVCVSQKKQTFVYFEQAKTSLLEELGQALCRDLNFGFVCMTVEGSLSVNPEQPGTGEESFLRKQSQSPKNTMKGGAKGEDI